jgi:hypothetical protein
MAVAAAFLGLRAEAGVTDGGSGIGAVTRGVLLPRSVARGRDEMISDPIEFEPLQHSPFTAAE